MKFIFSLLVAVIVGSLSCSAADLDSVDYYSFDPMTMSALDYAVQPLAATSWDTSDQAHLAAIRNALTYASTVSGGSVFGWVQLIGQTFKDGLFDDILTELEDISSGAVGTSNSILWYAREIYNDTSELHNIYLSASSSALSLEEINDAIQNDSNSLKSLLIGIFSDTGDIVSNTSLINSVLRSIDNYVTSVRVISYSDSEGPHNFSGDSNAFLSMMALHLSRGGYETSNGNRTLYSRIQQLQEVLASDDDLALANSQKANREEIEDSFLNGSSGSTSLGVSDFGDLADVGGTVKDSLSLDGNATIGSFTSGLAAADSAGQGWFSEETRSQLDAVSSTVTYSLRDPDPYNMAGWEDRYYWLLGDDE